MLVFRSGRSAHEQIGFPILRNRSCELLHEDDVVWPNRSGEWSHPGFCRCSVSFFRIAAIAGGNEIFPGVLTASGSREHMIDRQVKITASAVLASESIPPEHIFPVQHYAFERNPHKYVKAHDARKRETAGDRTDHMFRMVRNRYGFSAEQQQNGLLGIADAQGFVTAVQYQNF